MHVFSVDSGQRFPNGRSCSLRIPAERLPGWSASLACLGCTGLPWLARLVSRAAPGLPAEFTGSFLIQLDYLQGSLGGMPPSAHRMLHAARSVAYSAVFFATACSAAVSLRLSSWFLACRPSPCCPWTQHSRAILIRTKYISWNLSCAPKENASKFFGARKN